MRQQYIKTSSRYLIPSIILLAVIAILIGIDIALGEQPGYLLLGELCYAGFISFCAVQTKKEQKKMEEIVSKGSYSEGMVLNLLEVQYEKTIGRFGTAQEASAYRIEAEVHDEFGTPRIYRSDLLPKVAIKKIPKRVKVYRYHEQICILWEEASPGAKHSIKKEKERQEGNRYRMILQYLNGLFLLVAAAGAIGIGIDLGFIL